MFAWGRERYLTSANPTEGIKKIYKADRSEIIWSDDELERVINACGTEELKHAIRLAVATGLRQGDLLTLPWNAIRGDTIVRKTSKRGRIAFIPVQPLQHILDAIPRRSPVILTNSHGRPWEPRGNGLRSSFDKAKLKAGIENRHWHDLRGTAATKLFEMGVPEADIAIWMAWSPTRLQPILDMYVAHDRVSQRILKSMNGEHLLQTAYKPGEDK